LSSGIEVHELSPADEADWTAYVDDHPNAVFYQSLPWRDFLLAAFRHRALYLIARRGGAVSGVLPLFHVRWPLLGSKLISIPYDIGAGLPLADDEESARALAEAAIERARDRGAKFLELRGREPAPYLTDLGFAESSPVLISEMVLDGEKEVWSRVSKDHRKAERKARKRGVSVRAAETLEDHLAFYDVILRVFRDFGTPPYGRSWFRALHERLHDTGATRLLLAEVDGAVVGGLLLFAHRRRLVSKFAAVLPEAVPLRAYAALYADAIRFGLESGHDWVSWGTSSRSQTGLLEFKKRWGSETRPAMLYGLAVRGSVPDIERYYDTGGLSRRIWRKLPLGVTSFGGGVLSRWFC